MYIIDHTLVLLLHVELIFLGSLRPSLPFVHASAHRWRSKPASFVILLSYALLKRLYKCKKFVPKKKKSKLRKSKWGISSPLNLGGVIEQIINRNVQNEMMDDFWPVRKVLLFSEHEVGQDSRRIITVIRRKINIKIQKVFALRWPRPVLCWGSVPNNEWSNVDWVATN